MSPCDGPFCSQVPATVVDVMVVWCHSCETWKVHYGLWTQTGSDEPRWVEDGTLSCGPLTDLQTVLSAAEAVLRTGLVSSGRPWDQ